MKRLLIVGAGGFGREIFHWAQQHPDHGVRWVLGGFLDDNTSALEGFARDPGIIGTIRDYVPSSGDLLVCAIGLPKPKKVVAESLLARGAEFLTFLHPAATVGGHVQIGVGTVICPGAIITSDIRIGQFVTVNNCATIGHDATVGDYASLSCHVDITGFCKVGEGVFLGSHASMIPKSVIGDWALIGAGSMVMMPVEPGITVMGVPAKRISP
jgi:sugar O-acyltransferase (sialic acid O-acetyltransferase NeuD family)